MHDSKFVINFSMNKRQPTLTIITVTYNDIKGFIRTYKSIKPLLNNSIEWIIKDGGSSDLILKEIESLVSGENIYLISNKDSGTYNAMNIALDQAKSDWLIFMNGGDCFASSFSYKTLNEHINANKLNPSIKYIILGDFLLSTKKENRRLIRCKKLKECKGINAYRMPTCHQSQIFSRKLYTEVRFRENLMISADHAYFWDCMNQKSLISEIKEPISYFYSGGSSELKHLQSIQDIYFSLKKIQKVHWLIIILSLSKRFLALYAKLFFNLIIDIKSFAVRMISNCNN